MLMIMVWPAKKVWFFPLPRPQQLKVRKFAGSLFHGNISDVPLMSEHIPDTQTSGTGTRGQRTGRYKTGPNRGGAQGNGADCSEMLVCYSTRAQLTQASLCPTGSRFCLQCTISSSIPHWGKAIPLPSFQQHPRLEGWSESVSQPVTQPCWQGLPVHTQAPGSPESPARGLHCLERYTVQYPITGFY